MEGIWKWVGKLSHHTMIIFNVFTLQSHLETVINNQGVGILKYFKVEGAIRTRPTSSAVGARYRGVEGAEGVRCEEGVSSSRGEFCCIDPDWSRAARPRPHVI